jgi:hypothetical protein
MIQKASGKKAMGCTQVKEWFMQFKEGHTSVESGECSGRPSMSRSQLMTDKVCSVVLE